MSDSILAVKGEHINVWWADKNAEESFDDALSSCSSAKKKKSTEFQMVALLEKLGEHPVGHPEGLQSVSFPPEGDLPSLHGNKGKYYAVKKIPVRAYGWFYQFEDDGPIQIGDFVISHCIYKDSKKKKAVEDTRVANKWHKLRSIK
jgi:hypothetical protein